MNNIWSLFLGIECGEVGVILSERLKVLVVSREVGGRAIFSCEPGFGLRGPSETICQASGDWATPFPTCAGWFSRRYNTNDEKRETRYENECKID